MKKKYFILLILFIIVVFIIFYVINTANSEPVCDQTLWEHIYHPARLIIIKDCTEVKGTIRAVFKERDGDYHIRLQLDDKYKDLLNSVNIEKQHGDLVLEPICQNSITQRNAVGPCKGFSKFISVPRVGTHVTVTGSYVLDTEHGWTEIHPVTKIKTGWFDVFGIG